MSREKFLFTSESVSEGHPDKICDQVSDAILDEILKNDKDGRVAIETLVTTGTVIVAGEVTTKVYVDIPSIVRQTLKKIGYDNPELGFDYESCGVLTAIQQQSPDISQGVNTGGAGDQGLMFGFACKETPELMPMPIQLAHRIMAEVAALRKSGKLNYLFPDSKSQVTIEYVNGKPKRIDTIVISTHHRKNTPQTKIKSDLNRLVIKNSKVIPQNMIDSKTKLLVNPTGKFEVGGPVADTGVTGRKIIVDTYGGYAPHGGGAFSGKDPSKVDRSATYMARYVAKNVVAADLAEQCEVQLAYAIGVAEPVSVRVQTFGTEAVPEAYIESAIRKVFDLTPAGIIRTLKLKNPIYLETAAYGHFGRSGKGFTWENTDKKIELKKQAQIALKSNGRAKV